MHRARLKPPATGMDPIRCGDEPGKSCTRHIRQRRFQGLPKGWRSPTTRASGRAAVEEGLRHLLDLAARRSRARSCRSRAARPMFTMNGNDRRAFAFIRHLSRSAMPTATWRMRSRATPSAADATAGQRDGQDARSCSPRARSLPKATSNTATALQRRRHRSPHVAVRRRAPRR